MIISASSGLTSSARAARCRPLVPVLATGSFPGSEARCLPTGPVMAGGWAGVSGLESRAGRPTVDIQAPLRRPKAPAKRVRRCGRGRCGAAPGYVVGDEDGDAAGGEAGGVCRGGTAFGETRAAFRANKLSRSARLVICVRCLLHRATRKHEGARRTATEFLPDAAMARMWVSEMHPMRARVPGRARLLARQTRPGHRSLGRRRSAHAAPLPVPVRTVTKERDCPDGHLRAPPG